MNNATFFALACCLLFLSLAPDTATSRPDRLDLFPKLRAGQTVTYRVAYHAEKRTKTQSSVVMAQSLPAPDTDVQGFLRLDILGVEREGSRSTIRGRTNFQIFNSQDASDNRGVSVEFTIAPNGRIDQIKNLDALSAEQQQAWQQWASTFGAAAAFPAGGIKLDQKWKSQEPEKSPSPISGLVWNRASTYLRNEPCRITEAGTPAQTQRSTGAPTSAASPETCAVVQTTAALKQKSSSKDSTPEDFKLHQLRTSGTASGSNKTLLYISLTSGLIIRSSDQADQSMHVTIAKSDNSNRLHYDLHATSNTEIFQVANVVQNTP
jgi:hypothetical protein